jgi:hypothetical protein
MIGIVLLIGLPALCLLLVVLRISAFRVDKPKTNSWFGEPHTSQVKLLSASSYSAEGRRLLKWYWVVLTVFLLCIGYALKLLGDRGLL